MSHTHYYQEDTDEGLKIAALLNQLIESPGALSKKEWEYLNTLPIGTLMREAGIRPSMGSVSSPWDNAATESLMGLIKSERVRARTFETRDQAALEIFEHIECSCNRARTHSALGYLGPEEFEARHTEDAAPRAA